MTKYEQMFARTMSSPKIKRRLQRILAKWKKNPLPRV